MCGAPEALMRLDAHTLLFISHLLGTNNKYQKESAEPRRVSASGAPKDVPNCHLDKTNMDNSSMHLKDTS